MLTGDEIIVAYEHIVRNNQNFAEFLREKVLDFVVGFYGEDLEALLSWNT